MDVNKRGGLLDLVGIERPQRTPEPAGPVEPTDWKARSEVRTVITELELEEAKADTRGDDAM